MELHLQQTQLLEMPQSRGFCRSVSVQYGAQQLCTCGADAVGAVHQLRVSLPSRWHPVQWCHRQHGLTPPPQQCHQRPSQPRRRSHELKHPAVALSFQKWSLSGTRWEFGHPPPRLGLGRGSSPCTTTYSQLSKFPLPYTYIYTFFLKKIILKFGS